MTVPRGDVPKGVEAGDVVSFNGKPRLVIDVGKHGIQFVRLGPSEYWDTKRNAGAWYSLPIEVTPLRPATTETRLLAERFASWLLIPVPAAAWRRVCELHIAAIECSCQEAR